MTDPVTRLIDAQKAHGQALEEASKASNTELAIQRELAGLATEAVVLADPVLRERNAARRASALNRLAAVRDRERAAMAIVRHRDDAAQAAEWHLAGDADQACRAAETGAAEAARRAGEAATAARESQDRLYAAERHYVANANDAAWAEVIAARRTREQADVVSRQLQEDATAARAAFEAAKTERDRVVAERMVAAADPQTFLARHAARIARCYDAAKALTVAVDDIEDALAEHRARTDIASRAAKKAGLQFRDPDHQAQPSGGRIMDLINRALGRERGGEGQMIHVQPYVPFHHAASALGADEEALVSALIARATKPN